MINLDRIEAMFGDALDLPADLRAARVRELAADDTGLAGEVLELLAAADRAPSFLDDELIGACVGEYNITARIGSGGMGVVYRAVRDCGDLQVPVAFKVLRSELATPAAERLFAAEARALQHLDHPHVVALQDVGHLPDGRPYLVTELVDGRPIDQFCRDAGACLGAIVALFDRVCAAVQHAHRRLVVHCDLKPGNVLVTAAGVPKLLDFGISRVLGEATANGSAGHTERFASPEQRRGDVVSVASDVYSLGMLLGDLSESHADPEIASIIDRATQADPAERYESVADLADDLRAWRNGHPVAAHPSRLGYRLVKFTRRNRVACAAAIVALASLAIGATGLLSGLSEARRESGLAWQAHAQAAGVARFLEDLLADGAAGDPAFEDRLDLAVDSLNQRFAGWPEAEGRVRGAVGALYVRIGKPAKARAHLERAVELARSHRGFGKADRQRFARMLAALAR